MADFPVYDETTAPEASRPHLATDNWDDTVAFERFEKAGGRFVRGRARITAPGEVTVSTADGERMFRATRGIVLNPGTEPAVPPIDSLADTPLWTNREARITAADILGEDGRPPTTARCLGSRSPIPRSARWA
ncbi:MAG: hypothetical protein ACRDSL_25815 [Pseudonocardiaceae bacterium]